MGYEGARPPKARQRRASKFTQEGIQQIRGLIARGATCEDIAAAIGVTVGTLKVTCSRLGISLRRPRVTLLPPRVTAETRKPTGAATANFSIMMRYNGQEQETPLLLTSEMISQLALEASARDQRIAELARDLLQEVTEKRLFDKVLEG